MRALFSILTLTLALSWSLPLSAQLAEATTQGWGQGVSRNEAVQSALLDAAAKAFGVKLSSKSLMQSASVDATIDGDDHSTLLSVLNKNVAQTLNTPQNTPILGYDIDDVSQSGDSAWEASVTLRYARYDRLGADSNRRSVVVATNEKRYRALLIQTVGESLVGSRRFDVLNRENDQLFEGEKAFIQGEDAAGVELARLSQASGADYLVIAQLRNLGIRNNQRETIAMTGEVLVKSSVSGVLQLQVIEFASRKIKWSDTQKFGGTYPGAAAVGAATLGKLIGNAADRLVDRMVAAIYPIQVVKVIGDTAVINRGEGSVSAGEVFAVFEAGDELIDPQSGESLGAMETEVGLAKVAEVKPKFAILKMASGALTQGAAYIVRKTDKKLAPPASGKPAPKKAREVADKPKTPSRADVFLGN